jgi:hypothetical protein
MYMEFHLLRFSAEVQIILSSRGNKAVDRNVALDLLYVCKSFLIQFLEINGN